ncbi:metallophosphoesterase [Polaromonas sp.]|uniref:metallophosphoesterase family protein n=1 Tax=Polaromonas sp. TaxID=1869339 RepID=UPI00286B949B|nr:metallophosphoesterase [Polaromonas sp.]
MSCLLHISDPHFGTQQRDVLQALVDLARQHQPVVLVLSGDITQRAYLSQFRQARAFCDRLEIPGLLSLPGNHDISLFNPYQRLFNPYGNYLKVFGPLVETVVTTPWLQVIGVKTTRRWRHKNGEVGAEQIERVVRQLQTAGPQQLRVVVVHQPVWVPRAEDEHDRLRNWEPAVRAWASAGADIVMGGHIHLPYVCDLSVPVPGLGRRLWCVQAGTALSSRVRREAPNSVNMLRYAAAGQPPACQFQRWDFSAASRQFGVVSATELLLDRPQR